MIKMFQYKFNETIVNTKKNSLYYKIGRYNCLILCTYTSLKSQQIYSSA